MKPLFTTAVLAATMLCTPVLADRCRDVTIMIANDAGERMRVVQVRAYNRDDDRWRTIYTRNFEVDPTRPPTVGNMITTNIPKSDGEDVAIRVKYKFVYGGDNARYVTDSRYERCRDGNMWSLRIPGSGHRPN